MKYPLVSDLAASGIPVAVMCRVLEIARQPYYRWLANSLADSELVEALSGLSHQFASAPGMWATAYRWRFSVSPRRLWLTA